MRFCLTVAFLITMATDTSLAEASCCFSTAGTTSARLALWEKGAAGFSFSYSQDLGYFGAQANPVRLSNGVSDRQLRLDVFGLARVSDQITLLVLVPAIANIRTSSTLAQHDGGLSDISIGVRWDLRPFDHSGRLGVALVSSLSLPTGRDPNLAHTALAVDATGKGTAVASFGVSAELPTAPWFVRVDLVGAIPIPTFAGSWAWLSPTIDLTLTGGVRVISWLFIAANVRAGAQFPTAQQSAGYDSSVGAFAVLRPDPQWSLLFGANASLFVRGLGLNRTAPVSGSLGLRCAVW